MAEIDTLQILVQHLRDHRERPAAIAFEKDRHNQWTYAQLADQAQRVAAGLVKAGFGKGVHFALCAQNSPEWIAACLGVIAAGAVAVPLDVQLGDEALAHTLRDSGARFVFTSKRTLERLSKIKKPAKCEPILLGDGADGARGWQQVMAEPAEHPPVVSPDDLAVLFYTSGTTGPPKGVPLTHQNLAFQIQSLLAADLVTSDDRILLPLPLHHVYPFTIGMLTPLALGLPIVLPFTLTGPQLMRALREGEITTIIGVPRLFRAMLAGIETRVQASGRLRSALFHWLLAVSGALARLHLRVGKFCFGRLHREFGPQLRVLASGGAALEPEVARQLDGLGWLVGTGYGLTETSPLLTLDRPGQARLGSVGRPLQGVDVRVDPVDAGDGDTHETAGRSAQSRVGEIVARGPSVFAGYHNLPEKTKEAFTHDGWFRTGDLGYFDDDGFLFITGRIKTLIVLAGGEKVQPDEVEEAYQASPAIGEAGVLTRDGKLVAVIRPNRESLGSEQDAKHDAIRRALEEQSHDLASYKRIADFVLTTAPLPRTRLGKIQRPELEKLFDEIKAGRAEPERTGPISDEQMSPDDRALLDDPAARKTWQWLGQKFAQHPITPDTSPQLDLGIDSLEWLNLTLEIRQCCGVELDEQAISRIETVRDLLREVAERPAAGKAEPAADPLENPDELLGDERERWLAPLGPAELAAARSLYALNWVLVHSVFRLNVQGLEHVPREGPWVLAPNHQSYLDSSILAAALDFERLRETYWAGWTGIAFGPFFRWLRRLTHVVPIDPNRAAATSLAFGAAVLRDHHNLVWYPEGGHSKTGKLMPLRPGIGMLLEHYPVPVVPVALEGTREALPPGGIVPRPGQIRIAFGSPLDPHKLERMGKGDEPHQRITSALHDEMAKLCQN